MTGTDNQSSVVLSAQAAMASPMTYTPYGYLPPHHGLTLNDDPDSVTTATDFHLEFPDSTSSVTATIYSNGRNQVAVTIKTVLLDKTDNVVNLSPAQLWACLTLKTTRYVVIRKQPPDAGYAGLSVWNAPGDFTHAAHYDPDGRHPAGPTHRDSALLVYLSTAELAGAYEIFAELSFKHFSETTEGGSGEGHFESRLKINTLPEVDYGTSELWTMKSQKPSEKQTFRTRDMSRQREEADWYFYAQEYRLMYGGQHNEFYSFVETGETFRNYKNQPASATETHLYCARPVSALASWASQAGYELKFCTWAQLPWPLDIYGPNIGYQASH